MPKLMIATVAAAALMSFAAVAQTTLPSQQTPAPNYANPSTDSAQSNCQSIVDPAARTRCLNNMNPNPSQAQVPNPSPNASGTSSMPSTTTTTPQRSK